MKLEDLKVKITVDTTELDQFLEKLERAKRELTKLASDTSEVINRAEENLSKIASELENTIKTASSGNINITINTCG